MATEENTISYYDALRLAKRYNDALKVAKRNWETIMQMDKDCTFAKEGIVNTFYHMFPELKESEDESIRKQIIYAIKELHVCDETKRKCVAWLENVGHTNVDRANKEYWRGYREGKQEILDKYAEIEKQGEQIFANSAKTCKDEQKLTENKDYSAPFDIEIPFGAKDSELIQETIRIPDGCYASIEGNEIVIKKGQKSAEWSEEDDQYLLICKNALAKYQASNKWDAEIISHWFENKLKAPQNKWKPTDLQIEALESATENCAYSEYQDCLRDLIKQLKQLS